MRWIVPVISVGSALFLGGSQMSLAQSQNQPTRALVENCLSLCGLLQSDGQPLAEMASVEKCIGYIKGTSAAMIQLAARDSRYTNARICAAPFLANRTAHSPDEDPVIKLACNFGQWGRARPNLFARRPVEVVTAWMNASRNVCSH
jgi:hypothetical protein